MKSELQNLRCPECGALLLRVAQENVYPIEVRCRRCKETRCFRNLRVDPDTVTLDASYAMR